MIDAFSRNGHIREAALGRISGPLPTAFYLATVAYRMNDWVAQVRAAAINCAYRTFSTTTSAVVVKATPLLLGQRWQWGRWTIGQSMIDSLLGRREVVDGLFRGMEGGPTAQLFKQALRSDRNDDRLLEFATEAASPQVRSIAMKALIEGKVQWVEGHQWVSIDKLYNKWRRRPLMQERALEPSLPVADILELAATDRSPVVRKVAADGLIRLRRQLPNTQQVALLLRDDKSRAIRERIEWVERKLLEEAFEPPATS